MLDHDALEKAAEKLVANRERCRDRKRTERAVLKELKPKLFSKLPKGQTTLRSAELPADSPQLSRRSSQIPRSFPADSTESPQ